MTWFVVEGFLAEKIEHFLELSLGLFLERWKKRFSLKTWTFSLRCGGFSEATFLEVPSYLLKSLFQKLRCRKRRPLSSW